ncbi:COG2426 family protein [Intestinimonas butyriciproducens]|uniref:COG2426 family protein n=1 Tax=Intestinimonas butyriciproducens TaxID=1297617 RepID=UPI001FAED53D|nr:small multi-drug export protein [Intestinimonas butyriciproducens]
MDFLQWINNTDLGAFLSTVVVSMAPVLELRFGIPWGVAHGLSHFAAFVAAVIGNMIPLPFIVVYIRRIFKWMRRHLPQLDRVVDKLEAKAHLKGRKVTKYRYLGLMIFVAIPLPGTGGWTGALVAAFLDMSLRKSLPAIFAGVLIAGFLITGITFGFTSFF